MVVEYATISGPWLSPSGAAHSPHPVTAVYPATDQRLLRDLDGAVVWSGSAVPAPDGSLTLPRLPQADVDSDGQGWVLEIRPSASGGERASVARYYFELAEDCTWSDVLAGAITGIPQGVVAGRLDALEEQVSGYIDHGTVDDDLTLTSLGTHVLDADGPVEVTLPAPVNGTAMTVWVRSGAAGVTFTGLDLGLADTAPVVFTALRGVWVATVGGAAASEIPEEELIPVIATAPTFTDPGGTGADTYTIPTQAGVVYSVGGSPVAAGVHAGSGAVTITAAAAAGYVLVGTVEWSHTFDTTGMTEFGDVALSDTFNRADGLLHESLATSGQEWYSSPFANNIASNQLVMGTSKNALIDHDTLPSAFAIAFTLHGVATDGRVVVKTGFGTDLDTAPGDDYPGVWFTWQDFVPRLLVRIPTTGFTLTYRAGGGTDPFIAVPGGTGTSTHDVVAEFNNRTVTIYVDETRLLEGTYSEGHWATLTGEQLCIRGDLTLDDLQVRVP